MKVANKIFYCKSKYFLVDGKCAITSLKNLTSKKRPKNLRMECNLILQDEEKLKQIQEWEQNEEIQIFREYLRIKSVHSPHDEIDYSKYLLLLL